VLKCHTHCFLIVVLSEYAYCSSLHSQAVFYFLPASEAYHNESQYVDISYFFSSRLVSQDIA
jgi:hypothetical protein